MFVCVYVCVISSQSQSDSSVAALSVSSSAAPVSDQVIELVKLLFDCIEADGEKLGQIQLASGSNTAVYMYVCM